MNDNKLATAIDSATIESVVIGGDLAKLSPGQRVAYYKAVCESIGLNPLTKPFDYINLNGRLTLYARKDAADQLRKLHSISIDDINIRETDTQYVVTVKGHDQTGRCDVEIAVVNKSDMRGDTANAQMKAVTKGKRRFTLSICGLGMMDETEIETIPDAKPVVVADDTGEIVDAKIVEPHVSGKMSLDSAMAVQSSEGKAYGDLDTSKLAFMHNSIVKKLSALPLGDDQREQYEYKRDAIETIIAARKSNPAATDKPVAAG